MNIPEHGHSPPLSVLVPLDGSPHATIAIEAAKRLQPGRIVLLQVVTQVDLLVPVMILDGDDEQAREVRDALEAQAAPLQAAGHTVDVLVRGGDPASVIVEEAKACNLVVMTTRGRGAAGRLIFGSVADRVSRSSETPVMLIRANAGHDIVPTRIVVPLDGSPTAEQAIPVATRLAAAVGCPIALVRAIDLDDVRATIRIQRAAGQGDESYDAARAATGEIARLQLEAHRSRLVASGYDTGIVVLDSTPSFALLNEIGETDLVVMSSHGRSGYRRWLIGSVAEKLVREAKSPVVLVPTRADASIAANPQERNEGIDMSDNTTEHGERNMLELLHQEQYTPEEVAYVFGMDIDIILQAAHRHELPAVFIGHDVATIKRSDLLHWMEQRTR